MVLWLKAVVLTQEMGQQAFLELEEEDESTWPTWPHVA